MTDQEIMEYTELQPVPPGPGVAEESRPVTWAIGEVGYALLAEPGDVVNPNAVALISAEDDEDLYGDLMEQQLAEVAKEAEANQKVQAATEADENMEAEEPGPSRETERAGANTESGGGTGAPSDAQGTEGEQAPANSGAAGASGGGGGEEGNGRDRDERPPHVDLEDDHKEEEKPKKVKKKRDPEASPKPKGGGKGRKARKKTPSSSSSGSSSGSSSSSSTDSDDETKAKLDALQTMVENMQRQQAQREEEWKRQAEEARQAHARDLQAIADRYDATLDAALDDELLKDEQRARARRARARDEARGVPQAEPGLARSQRPEASPMDDSRSGDIDMKSPTPQPHRRPRSPRGSKSPPRHRRDSMDSGTTISMDSYGNQRRRGRSSGRRTSPSQRSRRSPSGRRSRGSPSGRRSRRSSPGRRSRRRSSVSSRSGKTKRQESSGSRRRRGSEAKKSREASRSPSHERLFEVEREPRGRRHSVTPDPEPVIVPPRSPSPHPLLRYQTQQQNTAWYDRFSPTLAWERNWMTSSPAGKFEFYVYKAWQAHAAYYKANATDKAGMKRKYGQIFPPWSMYENRSWIPRIDEIKAEPVDWPVITGGLYSMYKDARLQRYDEAADAQYHGGAPLFDKAKFLQEYDNLCIEKVADLARNHFRPDQTKKEFQRTYPTFFPLERSVWKKCFLPMAKRAEARQQRKLDIEIRKARDAEKLRRAKEATDAKHIQAEEERKKAVLAAAAQSAPSKPVEKPELIPRQKLKEAVEAGFYASKPAPAPSSSNASAASGGAAGGSGGDPTVRKPTKPRSVGLGKKKVDISKHQLMYSKKPAPGCYKDFEIQTNVNFEPLGYDKVNILLHGGKRITLCAEERDGNGRPSRVVLKPYEGNLPCFEDPEEMLSALSAGEGNVFYDGGDMEDDDDE